MKKKHGGEPRRARRRRVPGVCACGNGTSTAQARACRVCARAAAKAYYDRNKSARKAKYDNRKAFDLDWQREMKIARAYIGTMIKRGVVTPEGCVVCGSAPAYPVQPVPRRPLLCAWACRTHRAGVKLDLDDGRLGVHGDDRLRIPTRARTVPRAMPALAPARAPWIAPLPSPAPAAPVPSIQPIAPSSEALAHAQATLPPELLDRCRAAAAFVRGIRLNESSPLYRQRFAQLVLAAALEVRGQH